ncbi:amino acid ABC transporter substrate-binding protein (plasmid) [Deinococcus metallilatus]|uniref:Polar amino acid transport system substrate-binding protein n=1 Tax=Deinococcus metallilatus TaxID=1211322 RepID=A0ABR6MRK5_9DEIO|nr:ABC transporter substrate-binding protein [Deinococcus metallilatus]MBB5293577.1 polar amino acid transport system substrate-binding protein [Deinococcus metallilatus]QBY06644.1 amino acid ABC transporter substrate-binding protein [Deinococcus metallilatus]RXJ17987.1 amino acid ABC transporter substrate-binding protein [Deinococcus metallilatus]GMA15203.1 amino acid ABC transporter substrate-binding protein [Deinococcus metallilatus]
MFKWKRAISLLSLGALGWAGAAAIPTLLTPGSLTIGTDPTYAPFIYLKGKTLTGFEVELMNEVARRLDLKPVWKYQPFDNLLIGLNQNRFDIVVGSHGITPERLKAVDFSTPDYCSGGVILSRAGGPRTVADLRGKVVAVQVGTTYYQRLRAVPGVGEIRTLPGDPEALQHLLSGRSDAFVTDRFVALAAQAKAPPGKLQLGSMLFQEKIGFAVKKGNTAVTNAVDGALKSMMQDGTYEKISRKYFNTDIRCK